MKAITMHIFIYSLLEPTSRMHTKFHITRKEQKSMTPLMIAACNNDFNAVIDTVELYVKQFSASGKTALQYAIYAGNTNIAEFLVHHEQNCYRDGEKTALMIATDMKMLNIAQQLTSEFRLQTTQGKSALYYAIRNDFPEQKKYRQFYKSLLSAECEQFFYPRNLNTLGTILESGCDLIPELLEQLIEQQGTRPCDIEQNIYPLALAALFNSRLILGIITSKFRRNQLLPQLPLHALAQINKSHCIDLLCDFVGLKNSAGQTALMLACKSHNIGLTKFLIISESRMQDNTGKTALMYAAESGFTEGVELLLDIERQIKDKNNSTALSYACEANNQLDKKILYKMIWLLAEDDENAIEIAIRDNSPIFELLSKSTQKNHIHLALAYNNQTAIRHFLSYKRTVDKLGNSELITCVRYGQGRHFDRFQDQVGKQNTFGETALITAVKYFNDEESIPKFLLYEVGCVDFSGRTALAWAILMRKREFVKLLLQVERQVLNQQGKSLLDVVGEENLKEYLAKDQIKQLVVVDYFKRWKHFDKDAFGLTRKNINLLHEMVNELWSNVE